MEWKPGQHREMGSVFLVVEAKTAFFVSDAIGGQEKDLYIREYSVNIYNTNHSFSWA